MSSPSATTTFASVLTKSSAQLSTSPPSNTPSPIPTTTRSRSTSDPARLPSSLDSDVSGNAALEDRLATLDKGLKSEDGPVVKEISTAKSAQTTNSASMSKAAPTTKATRTVPEGVSTGRSGGSSNQKTNGTTSRVGKGTKTPKTTINSSSTSPCKPVPMPKHLPTKPIDQLSSTELKALSSSTVPHLALTVLDPTNPTANPTLLFKSYPLPLLMSISPRITNILKSRTNVPTGLVLHSPTPTALHILLRHTLLASHHGSLTHPLATRILSIPLDEYAFYKYSAITADCIYLGFPYLPKILMQRMQRIAVGQVHSNDVGVILRHDVEITRMIGGNENGVSGSGSWSYEWIDGWLRTLMARSIATAIWEGRLQYRWKYDVLRREYPGFDREVREYIDGWIDRGFAH